jgi:hypothetical protein
MARRWAATAIVAERRMSASSRSSLKSRISSSNACTSLKSVGAATPRRASARTWFNHPTTRASQPASAPRWQYTLPQSASSPGISSSSRATGMRLVETEDLPRSVRTVAVAIPDLALEVALATEEYAAR